MPAVRNAAAVAPRLAGQNNANLTITKLVTAGTLAKKGDVLVEFEDGEVPGFGFVRIQEELSRLLGGRRVDLLTSRALSPFLREKILRSAETRYGA